MTAYLAIIEAPPLAGGTLYTIRCPKCGASVSAPSAEAVARKAARAGWCYNGTCPECHGRERREAMRLPEAQR